MYEQLEKSKEHKSRAVYNSVAQKKSRVKQGFGFVDNRSEGISQGKRQKASHGSSLYGDSAVQRAVSDSAMYAPGAAASVIINALEGQIAAAELAASNFVQNIGLPPGYIHTPTQAAYMANPTAALWGMCVEEQLNPLAIGLGWTTQYPLTGSRPDYHQVVGGVDVFVDLTTALQAGVGGNHITGKLATAVTNGDNPATWQAADITHANLNPLNGAPPVIPNYNGNVTQLQMQRLQLYNAYCNDDNAEYDEAKDIVRDLYNGPIHHTTFTQIWNAQQRQQFSARVRNAQF